MKIALPRKVMMIIKKFAASRLWSVCCGRLRARFDPCAQTEGLGYYNFRAPEEVKKLSGGHDTGIEHGTVTVLLGRDGYEVTTYRIDGAYEDSAIRKRFCLQTD